LLQLTFSARLPMRADGGLYGAAPYGAFYQPTTTVIVVAGGGGYGGGIVVGGGIGLGGGGFVGRRMLQTGLVAPAAGAEPCQTVEQVLASTPSLSRLAMLSRNVAEPLKAELSSRSGSSFTFFAPSDAAFQALLTALPDAGAEVPELVRNATAMTALLSYHFAPNSVLLAKQLSDGQQLQTALGGTIPPLRVRRSGAALSLVGVGSEAAVTQPDLKTCRGVIHVIDTVLLPVRMSEKQPGSAAPAAARG
jgi:transforming growth factor-beta-induced protein